MNTTQRIIRWVAATAAGLLIASATATIVVAQTPEPEGPRARRMGPGRAGPGGPGFPGRGGGPLGLGVPGMSESQREQARAIVERYEPQTEPLREQLRAARQVLNNAVTTSPVDEVTIRQASAEIAAAEVELAVLRAHMTAEVMTLLTPEQLERLQERRDRMAERRENGPRARRR